MVRELGSRVAEAEDRLAEGARLISEQGSELLARRNRIRELERVADRLSEQVVDSRRELERVTGELERLRRESEARLDSFAALAAELDEVRGLARGQATRIRLKALRDAAELTERISELARRPAGMRERLLEALEDAIERIGADGDPDPQEVAAESNGHRPRAPAELFEGLIEVEIGPLRDFSQLVGFEDAAGAIGATSQISVRRFTQGRATLDLRLTEPVELLRELEERAPFEFKVRDTRSDRLILDVDDD